MKLSIQELKEALIQDGWTTVAVMHNSSVRKCVPLPPANYILLWFVKQFSYPNYGYIDYFIRICVSRDNFILKDCQLIGPKLNLRHHKLTNLEVLCEWTTAAGVFNGIQRQIATERTKLLYL